MIKETLIERYINEMGEFIATPRGTSMWPLIRHCRDTVYLKKFDGQLKKYDIPLYKREDGKQVLHRCLSVDSDGTYTMCGDNQTMLEHGVRPDQIIGVTQGIYRDEKYISCSNKLYRLYVRLWCSNLRLRGYALKILHKMFSLEKVLNYPNQQK